MPRILCLLTVLLLLFSACSSTGGSGTTDNGTTDNGTTDNGTTDNGTTDNSGVCPSSYCLPDTGQTGSYTDTFGEDSDYLIHPPAYRDNGDGTVNDLNTGLVWQQATSSSTMNWDNASSYCSGLSLAGYSDWRLPTAYEPQSIVDYGKYMPSIDTTAFPGTQSSRYWSSTTSANFGASFTWYVYFDSGFVDYWNKNSNYYVRCVRGSSSVPSFTDNGDSTVTDSTNGLMWQQTSPSSKMTWEGSLTYCEGLTLANQSDWRLPNIKELGSIVDLSQSSPSIDTTAFPGAQSSVYWSSTINAVSASNAWGVGFSDGDVDDYSKSVSYDVRCVRGG